MKMTTDEEYNAIWEAIGELPSESVLRPLLPHTKWVEVRREKARTRRFKVIVVLGIGLLIALVAYLVTK